MIDPAEYGQVWADVYDTYPGHPTAEDAEPAADLLRPLADAGAALEFGIGTGRIALPLAARGVEVHGVDASPALLARLADKPGGDKIRMVVGDMGTVRVDGHFELVYSAFNTLLMAPTQREQARCFGNAAAHLGPGGVFVVESFVPDPARIGRGRRQVVRQLDDAGAWLLETEHDPVSQVIVNCSIRVDARGVRRYPVTLRYSWPSELDLMAELAGFRLVERWADWSRTPYSADSRNQVSVYRLDPGR